MMNINQDYPTSLRTLIITVVVDGGDGGDGGEIMHRDHVNKAASEDKVSSYRGTSQAGKSILRMDPTLTQKEETYKVILNIIKNTPYYNAFLISADV
ncbi:hypothetical protein Tco_0412977 [Tanacetum coccineum]